MAVTAGKISRMLNGRFTERQVRNIIQGLIVVHHKPIASSVSDVPGFFVPTKEIEREHYCRTLKARIAKIALRLRAFEEATADRILKQLDLWEDQEWQEWSDAMSDMRRQNPSC